MSDKKHELLLIFAALLISAFLMIYGIIDSPKYASLDATLAAETTTQAAETKINSSLVNINTASLEELMQLSGIGEERAKKIIEYRNKNGRFRCVDELSEIDGIGSSTIEKNRSRICV